MADIYIDVDAALTELPVNKVPLVAAADGDTIDEGVTYDEAGMDLNWNFITSAGSFTQTNVVPTTAGVHDWTHQGNGMYTLEIPASAGTINNDTEGYGWFSGTTTATLPFISPTYGFRAAALNDALMDGGDVLDVSVTELGGVAQSATDLKDFADAGYDPATNKVQGVVLVDTSTDVTNGVDVASISGDTAAANNLESAYDGTGYAGGTIKQGVDIVAISGDATAADNLESYCDGTTPQPVNLTQWVGVAPLALISQKVQTEAVSMAAGAITAAAIATGAIDADSLAADAVTKITDDIMADIIETEGSYTLQQFCSVALSALAGVTSNSGNTLKTPNGVANRIAATTASNERSAMTLTPSS